MGLCGWATALGKTAGSHTGDTVGGGCSGDTKQHPRPGVTQLYIRQDIPGHPNQAGGPPGTFPLSSPETVGRGRPEWVALALCIQHLGLQPTAPEPGPGLAAVGQLGWETWHPSSEHHSPSLSGGTGPEHLDSVGTGPRNTAQERQPSCLLSGSRDTFSLPPYPCQNVAL